ncbi:MAG: sensor histidine kinase [Myxococcales bacterium]
MPLIVLAPTVVAWLGLVAAVTFGWMGVTELRKRSDHNAALAARVIGATVAARLRASPSSDRGHVLERAARRAGVELILVDARGTPILDATTSTPSRSSILDLLVREQGTATTSLGRVRFVVVPVKSPRELLSLIALVPAPDPPQDVAPLVTSLVVLASLLLGVAALVALALTRDVHSDVDFVRRRIEHMSLAETGPFGWQIPVRSVDQVGELTSAFNDLVGRFTEAERRYRQDLGRALTYDRDRSAFLAALSHELRTPLNAILGFSDVLLSEVDGPLSADARENLEIVRTSGRHLASLIDDILDLSAIESGQLRLARSYVDLYAIAESVVREAQVTAHAKGLEVYLKGERAMAWADPRRVRQMLNNVVGNAVKFTLKGYVEVVVTKENPLTTTIRVTDTGPGIAPNEQMAIFEEYRQAGEERVRRAGTGLGLAITRRLVGMHGGRITLASDVGKGSIFSIHLPAQADHERESGVAPVADLVNIGGPT